MRQLIKQNVIMLTFLAIGGSVFAQLSLTGEVRPRTEYRHGYKALADTAQDPALFTDQRTRLYFNYKYDNVDFGVTVQDIRTWGSQSQLNLTDGLLSLHEAWGEVHFNKNFSLKAGRQELVYDDHRILGSVGWAQQARSHDLALFKYQDSTFSVHAGIAYNQDKAQLTTNVYTVAKSYKAMQFLWLHKKMNNLSISALFLNNGKQYSEVNGGGVTKYSIKYSQTLGSRVVYKKEKLSLAGNAYYQMGKDASNTEISAYNIGVDASYKLSGNLSATIGYELLSGTSQTDTGNTTNNSFAPLYGTNHKFNGFMDYFYVGNHGNNVGLQDPYVSIKYKKGKMFTKVDAHFFMAAADILDQEALAATEEYKAMDPYLGTEIDVTAGYTVSPAVKFQAGYSHMLGTESMVALKGGNTGEVSNWAYLMLTIKPALYKQEK